MNQHELVTPFDHWNIEEEIDRGANWSKYKQTDGKFRLITASGPVHWRDAWGSWRDVDLTPKRSGGKWVIEGGPTRYAFGISRPSVEVISRNQGAVKLTLDSVGGQSYLGTIDTEWDEHRLVYRNIANGADVRFHVLSDHVRLMQVLKNMDACKNFRWSIEEEPGSIWLDEKVAGMDRNKFALELESERCGKFLDINWTGRVRKTVDARSRRRDWVEEENYPVEIDPVIWEAVSQGNHDAYDVYYKAFNDTTTSASTDEINLVANTLAVHFTDGTTLTPEDGQTRKRQEAGVLWSMSIPAGASIDRVHLFLSETTRVGTMFVDSQFVDNGDMAVWADGNKPRSQGLVGKPGVVIPAGVSEKTVTGSPHYTDGLQLVVDKASYASGNLVGMVIKPGGADVPGSPQVIVTTTKNVTASFEAYEAAGSGSPRLEIVYCPASSSANYVISRPRRIM